MQHSQPKLLTFAVDDRRFAVDLDDVQEVVRAVSLARLPKAPAIIEGLVDLRGSVIAVLDLRSRFRMPPKTLDPADHLVVARASRRVVGIRVDRVLDVVMPHERDIDDIGGIAPTSDYIAGVARLANGLVLIHDLDTFLSESEAQAIAEAVGEGLPS